MMHKNWSLSMQTAGEYFKHDKCLYTSKCVRFIIYYGYLDYN
jgi:hypothetical protein